MSPCKSQIISGFTTSNNSLEVGDTLHLYYKLSFPSNLKLRSVDYSVLDSLILPAPPPKLGQAAEQNEVKEDYADLEWIRPDLSFEKKLKSISGRDLYGNRNESIYSDTITVLIWDYGNFILNLPNLKFDSIPSNIKQINTQPPNVIVTFPQEVGRLDSASLLPIKTIIKEEKTIEDYFWIGYVLLGILALSLLFFFLKKRNQPKEIEVEKVVIKRPPHVVALEKLRNLRQSQYWKKNEIKRHQTELTYTIREYLEERFEINALESTTDQISKALKEKEFSVKHETELKEILQIADLVKFAKAEPSTDINESFIDKAAQFVNETKRVIIEENKTTDG